MKSIGYPIYLSRFHFLVLRCLELSLLFPAYLYVSHHSDYWFMPCLCVAYTEDFKEPPNAILVAVGVLAAKATHRIELVGLKIGCSGVQLVGVLMKPRTSHVMLVGSQRRLVKPARFQRCNDGVSGTTKTPRRCYVTLLL